MKRKKEKGTQRKEKRKRKRGHMGGNNTKQKDTKTEEEKLQEELDKEEPIDINVEWNCGECTYLNKSGTIECSVCSFKRVLVKRRRPLPPPTKEDTPELTPEQKLSLIEEKVTLIMKLQDIKDGKLREEKEEKEEEENESGESDTKKEEENVDDEEKEGEKDDIDKKEEKEEEEKEEKKEEKETEEEETIEQHKKRLKIVNELLLRQQLKLDEVSGPEIREKRKELTKIILKRMEENDKIIASLN